MAYAFEGFLRGGILPRAGALGLGVEVQTLEEYGSHLTGRLYVELLAGEVPHFALYLSQLCRKVYLVVRKPFLRASKIMQERVMAAENIEILFEHNATGLYGENGVEGMHVVKRKGEADEQHYDVAIDGFFLAIGHKPNSDVFRKWVDTDEVGYIKTIGTTQQTRTAGLFAAGDVCDPTYRQAVVAAGTGCKAALEAERYLQTL